MSDILVEAKAYTYSEYRELIHKMREQGMATGGNSTEAYLNYTDLNNNRMDKWDKRFELSEDLKAALDAMDHKERWVILTEGWCGDAAHSVPMIAKMAEYSTNIKLEILLRDENLTLMDQYLTNGGRSIPKLIRFDEQGQELGTWGPRPEAAQQIMTDGKAAGREKADITIDLQKWYARDRGATINAEFSAFLK